MAKQTNEQKYKTPKERGKAFTEWCSCHSSCRTCEVDKFTHDSKGEGCQFHWLALEADEEKPDPCPFCGGKCSAETVKTKDLETGEVCSGISVLCYGKDGVGCGYQSKFFVEEADAISAHNRVARAVRATKKINN